MTWLSTSAPWAASWRNNWSLVWFTEWSAVAKPPKLAAKPTTTTATMNLWVRCLTLGCDTTTISSVEVQHHRGVPPGSLTLAKSGREPPSRSLRNVHDSSPTNGSHGQELG